MTQCLIPVTLPSGTELSINGVVRQRFNGLQWQDFCVPEPGAFRPSFSPAPNVSGLPSISGVEHRIYGPPSLGDERLGLRRR